MQTRFSRRRITSQTFAKSRNDVPDPPSTEDISMQRMRSCQNAVYLFAAIVVLQTTMVHCEPNPEPTRRVEVTNLDDLRKYLDHLTDLYTLKGKARYGKRGEIPSAESPVVRNWDTMKFLDASQDSQQQQQHQQPRFDQRRLASRQFLREMESSEDGKHASRPYQMLDIVEKYYDGVQ
ncbi:neuropeptide F [Lasioglossum baleicum]|uniref:neuropeptide F n=1 Tax=Lasioglossum baleicum TaxID=434251 RepID=UPI003FCDAE24